MYFTTVILASPVDTSNSVSAPTRWLILRILEHNYRILWVINLKYVRPTCLSLSSQCVPHPTKDECSMRSSPAAFNPFHPVTHVSAESSTVLVVAPGATVLSFPHKSAILICPCTLVSRSVGFAALMQVRIHREECLHVRASSA